MPFVEVRQSGPDIPDGGYPLILTGIKGDDNDPNIPRHVVPEQGPNAGKDLYFWDWQWAVDAPGHPLDGFELEYGTSTATGPRSKMFGVLTALQNGSRPQVGQQFEKSDLIGRRVLGTVQHDEAGVSRIISFAPMPLMQQQASFAAATSAPGAPAAVAAAPLAPTAPAAPAAAAPAAQGFVAPAAAAPFPAPAKAPGDDLPF